MSKQLNDYIDYIKTLFESGSRIIVAMSGGVDSSLTAALIKLAGFETIGVTLQLYRGENIVRGKTCCAGKDIQDAKNVANKQEFPHYVLDYTTLFQKAVIDDFINTYDAGKTPIPCGRCNQYVKFGHLLDFAKTMDANYLVTGHYVEKQNDASNAQALFRSQDKNKDQSYFLALTTKEQLKMLHFPLAKIEKKIVKELAAELDLTVATKQESMDICFIPDGDYKSFLYKIRPEMFIKGDIITRDGKILGQHNGLAGYTIGQRKNLHLNNGPWYVIELDTKNNMLIIGKQEELLAEKFEIEELNLLVDKEFFYNGENDSDANNNTNNFKEIQIQIRARTKPAFGTLDIENNIVQFNMPQPAITPGQICAFYDNERLLGGSIIKQKIS